MRRRHLVVMLTIGALTPALPVRAAETYPTKPIRIIVGFPPGGQSDATARLLASRLGELLGVSVVVENRPGANGTIAVERAANSTPDGHTLLLAGGGSLTLAPVLDRNVRYDAHRDFVPVERIARVPLVLAARSVLPVATVAQLVDYAKRHPGKLTCASSGPLVQMAILSLKASAGIDIVDVPYKGIAPAVVDIVAGRVDLVLGDVATIGPHVHSGALRLMANVGAQRARAFRDVPTMMEQGISGFNWETWHGILVPRATPGAVVARVQSAVRKAAISSEFRRVLEQLGFEPVDEAPGEFSALIKRETDRYRLLVSQTGLRVGP